MAPGPTSRTVWVYLRALGLVYAFAFASLGTQLDGLFGSRGILPAAETMSYLGSLDDFPAWRFPTFAWWSASDAALHLQWGLGLLLSILVVVGIANRTIMIALWALYLSMVTIGRELMGYQWDNLLLEAGLLAIFLLPIGGMLRHRPAPTTRSILWLHRWLLFRLMFSSGLVKLTSGDRAWHDLEALRYHYETQPIPHVLSWYAHQLPDWFQSLSAIGVFAIQLGASLLIFGPRWARAVAAGLLAFLQILILATGNYGFFNLLALALCLVLLDDQQLLRVLPRRVSAWLVALREPPEPAARVARLDRVVTNAFAASIVVVSGLVFARTLGIEGEPAGIRQEILETVSPFRSVTPYGLFAVMTIDRPEIEVEGSNDGVEWKPYVFRYKAGPLDRTPRWATPHMPRLDWQMWFAALSNAQNNPWLMQFLQTLLEGRAPVLDLLEHNPFPAAPPRYIRARVFDYRFTSLAERRASGNWWKRSERGVYFAPAHL